VPLIWALSGNSVVGPRASVFSPGKDGEAGDVCSIVDTAGCRQAENKPLEARSSFPTEPIFAVLKKAPLKESEALSEGGEVWLALFSLSTI
jgi:hypothetical protein